MVIAELAKWVGLGVLSSIGLGFGIPTGTAILFPHVARTALEHQDMTSALVETGPAVLCWGVGSALGELPPYLLANRLAAAARNMDATPLSNTRIARILRWAERETDRLVRRRGGLAIFMLSCWPNVLFDCAGVAAGAARIPIGTFLGATIAGKALVKAPAQAALVAAGALEVLDGADQLPSGSTIAIAVVVGSIALGRLCSDKS